MVVGLAAAIVLIVKILLYGLVKIQTYNALVALACETQLLALQSCDISSC